MNEPPPHKRSVVTLAVLGLGVLVIVALCIALFVSRSGFKQRLADAEKQEQLDKELIKKLTGECAAAKKAIADCKSEISQLQKKIDGLEKYITELKEKIVSLEELVVELQTEIDRLEDLLKRGTGKPFVNSVGMLLVPIPAGQFQMGSRETADEIVRRFGLTQEQREGLEDEHPQHNEQIRKPFYLSTREVTQQQYELVMKEPYPWKAPWKDEDFVTEGDDYPATHVTWDQAKEFCRRLTKRDGIEYRLPTEAEWEYACRAGTKTAYSFGDKPAEAERYAWFPIKDENTGEWDPPHGVGRKWPNRWGLYDMHGNVQEWCRDKIGPKKEDRVLRGGSIYLEPALGRSASRSVLPPEDFRSGNGFRVASTFHP